MAKTDKEKAAIIMRRKGSALWPASAFDDEMICALSQGVDIEVSLKQRRSLPQMRQYWVMLANVVEATEAYPTAEHMHEALKVDMGYTVPVKTPRGTVFHMPDSIAFARMGPVEFKGFFDRAIRLISETYGIDPMSLGRRAA